MRKVFFLALTITVIVPLICMLAYAAPAYQTANKLKASEEEMREYMLSISKQLNVACTACHIQENFKSDKIPTFKVALEHIKLTQLLIDKGFDGKNARKADCFMCHRGELKPKY